MEEFNDRKGFEAGWSEVFEDAELAPSEHVWAKVEAAVANQESDRYRRRLLFFKMLAAASIAFAISLAGASVYFLSEKNQGTPFGETNNGTIAFNDDVGISKDRSNSSLDVKSNAEPSMKVYDEEKRANVSSGHRQNNNASADNNEFWQEKGSTNVFSRNEGSTKEDKAISERASSETLDNHISKIETNESSNSGNVVSNRGQQRGRGDYAVSGSASKHVAGSRISNGSFANYKNRSQNSLTKSSSNGQYTSDLVEEVIISNTPTSVTAKGAWVEQEWTPAADMALVVVPQQAGPVYLSELSEEELKAMDEAMRAHQKEKSKDSRELWAGVNFGAGTFDPNLSGGGRDIAPNLDDALSSFNPINTNVNNTTESPGASYAFGIDVGKKISKKWVIETGVQYAYNESETVSNISLQPVLSKKGPFPTSLPQGPEGQDLSFNNRTTQEDYQFQNTFEFVSVPVRAGYIVYESDKVGVLVSAGVSTDVFLKNTSTDTSGKFENKSIAIGDESPYRTFNFNGIVGGEVFYRFLDNYVISVEPSYKEALNEITRSGNELSSNPRRVGVGFRLRYTF